MVAELQAAAVESLTMVVNKPSSAEPMHGADSHLSAVVSKLAAAEWMLATVVVGVRSYVARSADNFHLIAAKVLIVVADSTIDTQLAETLQPMGADQLTDIP